MLSKLRALFSQSKVEIFFLKDCQQGFKGEIKLVKPNHIKVQLLPHALAQYNLPGFRKKLLPDLDEQELKNKVAKRAQIVGFQRKIQSIAMEFVRVPKFSNPEELKDPIDDEEIIKELNNRYKFKVNKKNINLGSKILGYGQTQVSIENYYSPELDDYVSFQVQILTKKPVVKASRLFIDEATGDPTQQKPDSDKTQDQDTLKADTEKKVMDKKDKKEIPKKPNQKEKQLDDVEAMLQEKVPKEPKEAKQKESKQPKDTKEQKEQKDLKDDIQEQKGSKETKEPKETKAQKKQK